MDTQQEREFVEAVWERVRVERGRIWIKTVEGWLDPFGHDWHAAYLFTVERLRQIAEVQEGIAWLLSQEPLHPDNFRAWNRIFAREKAFLADLQRGMK